MTDFLNPDGTVNEEVYTAHWNAAHEAPAVDSASQAIADFTATALEIKQLLAEVKQLLADFHIKI